MDGWLRKHPDGGEAPVPVSYVQHLATTGGVLVPFIHSRVFNKQSIKAGVGTPHLTY